MNFALETGRPWPLGAHWDGRGVNVAVASSHAELIDLCLFDAEGRVERQRLRLAQTHDVFHGYLPGAGPGLVYGLRARGPWQPERGMRFNPDRLLLDPYAREIVGDFVWNDEAFAHRRDAPALESHVDNAATALKARVVDEACEAWDWGDDAPPRTPIGDTVLYELHVKGFTRRHPGVPEALRGSYAGLASDASIAHLKRLGVTAVSLLPVHQHVDEERLVRQGLVNYWGYNTIGFFAVEPRYASGAGGASPRDEFRRMVRRLHEAGLEVVLDVVFNHTAESDEAGPSISWRGLDNPGCYRLRQDDPALYENDTGCGNTLDLRQPRVLQLVLDSLRYWVQAMHVDGFRFDLATVLGRGDQGFSAGHAFFHAVQQDPVLAGVKLIAEPWDIGPGGYRLGQFPPGWCEWNDRFRDTTRSWWLGHPSTCGALAQRLAGSADLFHHRRRLPSASVNFIVAHDGFTLRDLLSHEHKRNEANGEDNRDGHGHNLGWNCGAEGPSDDPAVRARRAVLARSLLATLLLAQGTPMLCAGDELGHGQGGNNNPYCQDNETTWIDWAAADESLIDFAARAIALRLALQPLADRWYRGHAHDGVPDLGWLRPDGAPMAHDDWNDPARRALGVWIGAPGAGGPPLLWLLNGQHAALEFRLPAGTWRICLDASSDATTGTVVDSATTLAPHAVILLERVVERLDRA